MLCRSRILVACFVPVLSLVGCAIQRDRREAEQVLAHHFETRARGAYDAVLADYDALFFDEVTRSDWRNVLTAVAGKLGVLRRFDIAARESDDQEMAGPGTYLKYKCLVTYSADTAVETFHLFRKQGAAQFRILGHEIHSASLSD